jgi:hypothetical protein
MPAKQRDKQHADAAKQEQQWTAVIGGHVLQALGRPEALYRMEVRRLWQDRYRVNVFVGPGPASVRLAHSYFLVTDGGGNILAATPAITRQY